MLILRDGEDVRTYMLEDEHFVPKSGIVMYQNSNMRGFVLKRARKATTIQVQICCTILYTGCLISPLPPFVNRKA
jgi:hypothetical protein